MKRIKALAYALNTPEVVETLQVAVGTNNHFKTSSLTDKLEREISRLNLHRVAGNVFVCPSTKNFWEIKNGTILRISKEEVENNESVQAAPSDNPEEFLDEVLSGLTL